MNLLWIFIFLCVVFKSSSTSYLKNSRLCKPWVCINEKLRQTDADPSKEQFSQILSTLLPNDDWQSVVNGVVDVCYRQHKPRWYTNTCPGQEMLQCILDQLIDKCPEKYLRKSDACSPISSLAGFNYMFSQSRYENLEMNLFKEKRPEWFMKNYFTSNCCDLPQLFNRNDLDECGFTTMIRYYDHVAPQTHLTVLPIDSLKSDPLHCCDLSGFIDPSFIDECNFDVTWHDQGRLVISDVKNDTEPAVTPPPVEPYYDVQMVPRTCGMEECIFKKFQIVSHSGAVDMDAFSKLLDNLTREHPELTSAKARVVTKCLTTPITDYDADCEINKVLACTFDILSENCPYTKNGTDFCKNKSRSTKRGNIPHVCQISSSKLRPKRRRQLCDLPPLIKEHDLSPCGLGYYALKSIERPVRLTQNMIRQPRVLKQWLHYKPTCKESTESAKCVMNKMGILNKYGFIDYFKMKDRINQFTQGHIEWYGSKDAFIGAFMNAESYREHCTSQRKLMSVIDSMLMTCPLSRRTNTHKCHTLLDNIRLQPRTNNIKYPTPRYQGIIDQFKEAHSRRPRVMYSRVRMPFIESAVPATYRNSNLNVSPESVRAALNPFPWYLFSNSDVTFKRPKTHVKVQSNIHFGKGFNSSTPLVMLPVYMRSYTPATPVLPD